ncbi:hypothetical protein BH10CYA1_BH10CYA1_08880 [soil metagenome]
MPFNKWLTDSMFKSLLEGDALAIAARDWQSSTPAASRKTCIASVNQLYAAYDKEAPTVIVCQSPWQMLVSKYVLQHGAHKKLAGLASKPHNDPFMPAEARWIWKACWSNLSGQTTGRDRERLTVMSGNNIWSSAASLFLTQTGLSSTWRKQSPSLFDNQWHLSDELHKLIHQAAINRNAVQSMKKLENQYAKSFPFASSEQRFLQMVSSEMSEYAFGNQPTETKTVAMTILISPLIANAYQELVSAIKIDDSTGQQQQIELSMLALTGLIECVDTRSMIGKLPLYLLVAEFEKSISFSDSASKRLKAIISFFKATPMAMLYDDICLLTEQPVISRLDAAGRYHSDDGPALKFSDNFQIYASHGVRVEAKIIDTPEKITADKIIEERNLEVRRVMLEKFGMARFVSECGAKKIHEDRYGELYRKEIRNAEPLVIVKVKNSSPEPDGSFRDYFLRVPPTTTTAKQAVAWTFNMNEKEFGPDIET